VLVERTVHGLLATQRSGLLSIGAALALWSASAAFTGVINGLTAHTACRIRARGGT
jgi:uncharacterized BrkB/YihY/UPF0761 family membrane protein